MSAPEPQSHRKLTEAEWAEAKTTYELGKSTKVALAKKYGISRQAMGEGLTARGAVYGSKSKVIEDATVAAERSDSARKAEEITAMRERSLKSVELLQKLQNKIIAEAIRDNRPLASIAADVKALNGLFKNQALARQELWAIYDLDRDPDGGEEIPEFIVGEYTPDEIELLNRQRLGVSPDEALQELESAVEGEGADVLDLLSDEDATS